VLGCAGSPCSRIACAIKESKKLRLSAPSKYSQVRLPTLVQHRLGTEPSWDDS